MHLKIFAGKYFNIKYLNCSTIIRVYEIQQSVSMRNREGLYSMLMIFPINIFGLQVNSDPRTSQTTQLRSSKFMQP